ncbi:uncharacterized protein LOC135461379 [Liolophura sinensis]|uniref:uncharacterized protein LOC135461379 n=1 Tax=Liolophura sinensis TaxID=3198878 RepID=UPI00315848BD
MRVGCGVFAVAVWIVVFSMCTRGEDCLKYPGDVGRKEKGIPDTLGKVVTNILNSAELVRSGSEKTQSPDKHSCISSFWNQVRIASVAIPAWVSAFWYDAYNQVTNLRCGKAVLEFAMGFGLTSLVLCLVSCLMGGFDGCSFYDLLSVKSRKNEDEQLTHLGQSQEDQNTTNRDEPGTVQEDTIGLEDFEYVLEGVPVAQIGNSGEGPASAVTQQALPFSGDLHRTAAAPDLNRIATRSINSETEDLIEDREERTINDAPRLGLRPFRPPPPTVKVYSLHKPQEIPNDILSALLCLRKSCNHDHSKIRLIGSKVIVYGAKSPRYRAKRRPHRHSREGRSPWVHREPFTVVGEQVLSDEFELEEDLTSVSTQTETATTPPTSVIIRTEAFLQDENYESTPYFRGSMTGTLLLAKDSFDTKFVGGSWNQLCQTRSRDIPSQYSNVRESIVKSRPDIADLDDHFADLHEKLELPRRIRQLKKRVFPIQTQSNPVNFSSSNRRAV